jgi:hypothetical protein
MSWRAPKKIGRRRKEWSLFSSSPRHLINDFLCQLLVWILHYNCCFYCCCYSSIRKQLYVTLSQIHLRTPDPTYANLIIALLFVQCRIVVSGIILCQHHQLSALSIPLWIYDLLNSMEALESSIALHSQVFSECALCHFAETGSHASTRPGPLITSVEHTLHISAKTHCQSIK